MFDILELIRLMTAAAAVGCVLIVLRHAPRTPLAIYFVLFAGSLFCAALGGLYGAALGPAAPLIAVGGFAACGWSWLFARALFQPKPAYEIWPLAIVAAIFAPEIIAQAMITSGAAPAAFTGPFWRMADNVQDLASSTVLVMALVEAVRNYSDALPKREQRFRQIFIACYGGLVAIAVLWVSQSAAGTLAAQWKDGVQTSCMLAALAMAAVAFRYRLAFPMPAPAKAARKRKPDIADPEMDAMAARIVHALQNQEAFTTPNLKVADLAAMLGEPDYKISRCVTGVMGFPNFNRFINHHRIEHAKQMLEDSALNHQPILSIGLSCGFGSIGPFNRAFKEATGQTPRAYRNARAGQTGEDGLSRNHEADKKAFIFSK